MNPRQQDIISEIINQKTRFCPSNGICWNCGKDIFKAIKITEDMEDITGCPYCGASFVD